MPALPILAIAVGVNAICAICTGVYIGSLINTTCFPVHSRRRPLVGKPAKPSNPNQAMAS